MSAEQAIGLAERLSLRTGEAYAIIHVDSGYQAIPLVSAVGFDWLEIVRP